MPERRRRTFDRWIEQHQGLLSKVARAYTVNPDDREDLLQEMSLQLWNSIPNYRGESAESTWIYRVAFYTALSWKRRERKHRHGRVALEYVQDRLRAPAPRENPRLEWLYHRIAEMAPVDRSLMLLLLEGFSYREMSEILGITESNVGVKINRIKRRLATLVETT